MKPFFNTFNFKWINLLMSLLYLKECFKIGPEYNFLKLNFVVYNPFIHLLGFLSLYFWFYFINEKGLVGKVFFSIFII